MSYYGYGYGWYKPSKPRKVKAGIKAQGSFGQGSWWSQKWIKLLESYSYEWSSRLQRGRSYARRGQVVDYFFNNGLISAKVQGSMPKPYSVSIRLKPLSEQEWTKVTAHMASQAVFSAKLLSGEMPGSIEEAFRSAKVTLFPKSPGEIKSKCSCPDYANPCKHIAAVFYILAEEFDRNPFMMFEVRGRERNRLLSELRVNRAEPLFKSKAGITPEKEKKEGKIRKKTILVKNFWGTAAFENLSISIEKPPVEMAVLKRLGVPPFWKLKKDFMKEMGRIYKTVSGRAMQTAYVEPEHAEKRK